MGVQCKQRACTTASSRRTGSAAHARACERGVLQRTLIRRSGAEKARARLRVGELPRELRERRRAQGLGHLVCAHLFSYRRGGNALPGENVVVAAGSKVISEPQRATRGVGAWCLNVAAGS